MKILICLIVLILCAGVGYALKWKAKKEQDFLEYLKDFTNYFLANISLFKNNVVAIIDNYNITQKNKNAKFSEIFEKTSNFYQIESKNVARYISDEANKNVICEFLKNVGSNEYDYERKKAEDFMKFLDEKIQYTKSEKIKKSDLNFKLFLAVGAVICIIIWWVYGCFNSI